MYVLQVDINVYALCICSLHEKVHLRKKWQAVKHLLAGYVDEKVEVQLQRC